MTRSFHKTKETPIHCHTNAAGAVKSSPMKIKKEGHGSKGSWGSSADDIKEGRDLLENGDIPVSSPEREKSMRKLSVSSSSTSSSSSNDGSLNTNGGAGGNGHPSAGAPGMEGKIVEEDDGAVFDEPENVDAEKASANATA